MQAWSNRTFGITKFGEQYANTWRNAVVLGTRKFVYVARSVQHMLGERIHWNTCWNSCSETHRLERMQWNACLAAQQVQCRKCDCACSGAAMVERIRQIVIQKAQVWEVGHLEGTAHLYVCKSSKSAHLCIPVRPYVCTPSPVFHFVHGLCEANGT